MATPMKLNHLFSPTKRSRTQEQSQEHIKRRPKSNCKRDLKSSPLRNSPRGCRPRFGVRFNRTQTTRPLSPPCSKQRASRTPQHGASAQPRCAPGVPAIARPARARDTIDNFGVRARERIAANMRNKTIHGGYAEHAYPHFTTRLPDLGLCATSDGRFMRLGPRSLRDLRRDVIHTLDTHGVDTASSVGRFCGNDDYFCLFGDNGGFLWDLRGEAPALLASLPFDKQLVRDCSWDDNFIVKGGAKVTALSPARRHHFSLNCPTVVKTLKI